MLSPCDAVQDRGRKTPVRGPVKERQEEYLYSWQFIQHPVLTPGINSGGLTHETSLINPYAKLPPPEYLIMLITNL